MDSTPLEQQEPSGHFCEPAPSVLDVAGRAPRVAADLLAPQPRFGRAPLADAEHDRSSGGVEGRADIGIGCLGILRSRAAPVVLQVVDAPGSVLDRVLIFVPESAGPLRASHRPRVRINAELQSQRMNVVADRLHAVRKALRVDDNVSVRVAAHLPAVVNVDVHISRIFHA